MANKLIPLASLILSIVLPVVAMIFFAHLGMPLLVVLPFGLVFGSAVSCTVTQILIVVFVRKGVRPCA